ncbi:SRPBCC family protein [Novosphingobium guangzhouense]|uniref:Polyketide cyclase n=1 Tax=Novosphingobium guangzhouense TaxID=1850347 RepID=A0A2K2FUA1_9SPHN|nr:SRPBCC family protein [Novosphingobium guangzhouense]PNU02340.1 hypothetical protein A8V01_26470 [Novosphingobium guangzhouense]
MELVEVATRIEASAQRVWSEVGDFGNDRLTGGYVDRVEVKGAGLGALRTYHLADRMGGGAAVERLTLLDEAERTIAYDMVDYGPLNWADYSGHIKVTPAGSYACIFVIRTRFQPFMPEEAESLKEMSRTNIGMYIENLRRLVATRR